MLFSHPAKSLLSLQFLTSHTSPLTSFFLLSRMCCADVAAIAGMFGTVVDAANCLACVGISLNRLGAKRGIG